MPRFTVDLRFVEIESELWALGEFLRVIESQVQYLIAQDEVRMRAELREQGLPWEDPDVQLAFQEHDARAKRVFPRFMRAPFLVALCATYESAIEELANGQAKATKRSLLLKDIQARSWFNAARKYFEAVLLVPMDENPERLTAIGELFEIRNAFAHGNGQMRSVPDSKLKRLEEIIRQHSGEISIDDGLLTLESVFLKNAFANVDGSIRELVNKIRGGPAVRPLMSVRGA